MTDASYPPRPKPTPMPKLPKVMLGSEIGTTGVRRVLFPYGEENIETPAEPRPSYPDMRPKGNAEAVGQAILDRPDKNISATDYLDGLSA